MPTSKTKLNITITGASGNTGQALTRALSHTTLVRALVRSKFSNLPFLPSKQIIKGDLLELSSLKKLLTKTDALYLLGSITDSSARTPETAASAIAVNGFVPGLITYLRSKSSNSPRIIFTSSQVVYFIGPKWKKLSEISIERILSRDPVIKSWVENAVTKFKKEIPNIISNNDLNKTLIPFTEKLLLDDNIFNKGIPNLYPYKLAKIIAEKLLSEFDNVIIARMTNLYGPGYYKESQPLPLMLRMLLREHMAVYPSMPRDFVYVDDAIKILTKLATKKLERDFLIFNLASGTNTMPKEIIDTIRQLLPESEGKVTLTQPNFLLSQPKFQNDTAKKLLGKKFVQITQGLKHHIQWLSTQYPLG